MKSYLSYRAACLALATLLCAGTIAAPAAYADKRQKKPHPAKTASKSDGKKAPKGVVQASQLSQAPKQTEKKDSVALDRDFGDLPTYIKSDTLTFKSKERNFVYSGNVEVTHGDMILTADSLEGNYSEKNEIQNLTAHKNVTIIKGEQMRATGEQAIYDKASETMVLTDNPELQQNGSVLTADRIRIFMKENRSVAEGQVRVKLIKGEDDQSKEQPTGLDALKR